MTDSGNVTADSGTDCPVRTLNEDPAETVILKVQTTARNPFFSFPHHLRPDGDGDNGDNESHDDDELSRTEQ